MLWPFFFYVNAAYLLMEAMLAKLAKFDLWSMNICTVLSLHVDMRNQQNLHDIALKLRVLSFCAVLCCASSCVRAARWEF